MRSLAHALERVRRWWFFARVNAAYRRLQADPAAWAEELEERELWGNTLMDGLEDEPPWPDLPGTEVT